MGAEHPEGEEARATAAAAWQVRISDGLTPAAERELAAWLAADPRHAGLLEECRRTWQRFEPLVNEPGLAEVVPLRRRRNPAAWTLAVTAVAAVIAVGLWLKTGSMPEPAAPAVAAAPAVRQWMLPDGSSVELNHGAELSVDFTAQERRVALRRGEAVFVVVPDASRPFTVHGGGIQVRAVGTIFNVRLGTAGAEVLVTEGAVKVRPPDAAPASGHGAGETPEVLVRAGEQVAVSSAGGSALPRPAPLTLPQIEAQLAWLPKTLTFDDTPLAQIAAAFNVRNPLRIVVTDPDLAALRLSATFRADNVAGFLRLIEANYDVRVDARENGEVRLGRR